MLHVCPGWALGLPLHGCRGESFFHFHEKRREIENQIVSYRKSFENSKMKAQMGINGFRELTGTFLYHASGDAYKATEKYPGVEAGTAAGPLSYCSRRNSKVQRWLDLARMR